MKKRRLSEAELSRISAGWRDTEMGDDPPDAIVYIQRVMRSEGDGEGEATRRADDTES